MADVNKREFNDLFDKGEELGHATFNCAKELIAGLPGLAPGHLGNLIAPAIVVQIARTYKTIAEHGPNGPLVAADWIASLLKTFNCPPLERMR